MTWPNLHVCISLMLIILIIKNQNPSRMREVEIASSQFTIRLQERIGGWGGVMRIPGYNLLRTVLPRQ